MACLLFTDVGYLRSSSVKRLLRVRTGDLAARDVRRGDDDADSLLGIRRHTPAGSAAAADDLDDAFAGLGPAPVSDKAPMPMLGGPTVYGELFGSKLALAPHDARPFAVARPRRMALDDDVPRALDRLGVGRDAAATLYCCGPSELMDQAASFARGRKSTTYLHTETFEL